MQFWWLGLDHSCLYKKGVCGQEIKPKSCVHPSNQQPPLKKPYVKVCVCYFLFFVSKKKFSKNYRNAYNFIHFSSFCSRDIQFFAIFSFPFHPCSLLQLMRAITCAHASTRAPSLKRVKNSMCHFCLSPLSGKLERRKWKKKKDQI